MSRQCYPILWWILLLLVSGAGNAAMAPGNEWQSDTVVQAGTWSPLVSTQGQVRAWRKISLAAPFALSVELVAIQPGQRIDRGQALARIGPSTLRARLANVQETERRTELARQRLVDIQQRLANKLATRNDLLQAETDLSQAQSDTNSAWQILQDNLIQLGQSADRQILSKRLENGAAESLVQEWSTVRSPMPAVVAERAVAAGSRVAGGELLFRLEDLSRVIVIVWVAQGQASLWLHGTASVDVAGGGSLGLKTLTEVPKVDRQTGLVMLRFEAPNDAQRLLDGQWVTVHLEGPSRDVVWVPAAAVVGRAGKTYCIVRQDNGFEPVEVTVGPEQGGQIPVLTGLRAGDRVVTKGAYLLLYRDLNRLMRFQD